MYVVGSMKCPCTFINEVRQNTVFDTSNAEVLSTLVKWAPDFSSNPLSAINCIFEEKFYPAYNMAEGCWDTLDNAVTYYHYSSITIHALLHVSNDEELLISYEKPEPQLLEINLVYV